MTQVDSMMQRRRPVVWMRFVAGSSAIGVLALLSWWGISRVITHAEGSLPSQVAAADLIVALAGNPDRRSYALSLVKQGIAPEFMSTLFDSGCLREGRSGPACVMRVRNTIDEALVLRRIVDRERYTTVIVVTSRYHLARARAIFRVIFAGSATAIHFVATPGNSPTNVQIRREARSYLPSLAGALLARSVPSLYEWALRNQPVCQDLVKPSGT